MDRSLEKRSIEYDDGKCIWMINDKYHRLDGPAIENVNQSIEAKLIKYLPPGEKPHYQVYFIDNIRNRLNGPTLVTTDAIAWHVNGELHRLDGPARIYYSGNIHQQYYLYGNIISESAHKKIVKHIKREKKYKAMLSAFIVMRDSQNDIGEDKDYYSIPKTLVNDILAIEN